MEVAHKEDTGVVAEPCQDAFVGVNLDPKKREGRAMCQGLRVPATVENDTTCMSHRAERLFHRNISTVPAVVFEVAEAPELWRG